MKKLFHSLLISAAAFAVTSPDLQGAIVLDNSAFAGGAATDTSISNFTVKSGSNRMLVAMFTVEDGSTISGIKFGTDDLFLAAENEANFKKSYIYYLSAPTVGTADITVSGVVSGESDIALSVYSLQNVVQSGPFATANSATAGNGNEVSSVSLPITTEENNSWVFQSLITNTDPTITPDSGQTVGFNQNVGSASAAFGYQAVASAGSTNLDWSFSPDETYTLVAAEFAVIPEPSTGLLLVVAGLTGLMIRNRRA
jgi:hypothetical protein